MTILYLTLLMMKIDIMIPEMIITIDEHNHHHSMSKIQER